MSSRRLPEFVITSRRLFAQVLLIESAVRVALLIRRFNTEFSDVYGARVIVDSLGATPY